MFITQSQSGYNRDGEQFARGRFLLVFSHNKYRWAEETGRDWHDFPAELERRLYACARHVSLRQLSKIFSWVLDRYLTLSPGLC